MSRATVAEALRARRATGSGALIGYLPVGFPDLDASVAAAVTVIESGFDVIELGVPYSDPVMDGTVIQAATQRALAGGFRLEHVFEAVRAITERVEAPVVLMSYFNPILQHGVARFAERLKEAGGAGVITPDLIPDEASEWLAASDEAGIERIFLAAPTSSDERLRRIGELSRGFVYTVSTMGITGARSEVDSAARGLVARLRVAGVEHACVGLGISTPEQVSEVLEYADGAIIGSALVRALAEGGLDALGETARSLATGRP